MPHDPILCGLIDQNILARETYLVRRQQEALPGQRSLSLLDGRARTLLAEAVWRKAEQDLWRYRAASLR